MYDVLHHKAQGADEMERPKYVQIVKEVSRGVPAVGWAGTAGGQRLGSGREKAVAHSMCPDVPHCRARRVPRGVP